MVGDLLQPTHLLFVLVVALLVLGPKRLPEVGRALGRGLRDFRHAMSGEDHPEQAISQETPPAAPPSAPDAAPETAPDEQPTEATVPQAGAQPDDKAAASEPVGAAVTNTEPHSHS